MCYSKFTDSINEGDVIIFTVMNDRADIFQGFHTMAAQYIGGRYIVYNHDGMGGEGDPRDTLINNGSSELFVYGIKIENH